MESTLVGTEIVEQIAAREGIDPANHDLRLSDRIDPDALEALTNGTIGQQRQANLVMFTCYGYVVTVDGGGRIIVDEQAPERKRTSHRGKRQ